MNVVTEIDLEVLGFIRTKQNDNFDYFYNLDTSSPKKCYIHICVILLFAEISDCTIGYHIGKHVIYKELKNIKTLEDIKNLIYLLEVK
jgi:hypothetical protein